MLARLRSVTRGSDHGASAVEYGLLVAGIAAVIVAVVFLFGNFVSGVFQNTCDAIARGGDPVVEADCDGGTGAGTDTGTDG